ncbi:MAG: hypothetical protein EOO75_07610 [Myxococcales bacterium]|nr:MAG: hypothetical protein EOO75_07610 [Myxococcales bacterium]
MNLGGGALFASSDLSAPALAPPDFSAPPPPEPEPARPVAAMAAPLPQSSAAFAVEAPKKSSKGPIIGGVLALVAVLAGGGIMMSMKQKPNEDDKAAIAAADAAKKPADTAAADTAKKPDEAKTGDTAKPAETGAAAADTRVVDIPDPPPGKELTPEEKKRRDEAFKKKKEEDEKKKSAAEEEKKKKEEEEKKKAAAAAAPAAAADGPGGDKPFDRAGAGSALGSIAAGVGSCKKGDGPSGSGRIAVTFAPSGNVTTATIEGGDFAGTSVGSCIAARFRSAKVAPFSGSAVTVKKSFTVN